MIQDILTLDEILFLIFIGVIIGLPLGWLLFTYLGRVRAWLHYHLKVKQRYKPQGMLRDFADSYLDSLHTEAFVHDADQDNNNNNASRAQAS